MCFSPESVFQFLSALLRSRTRKASPAAVKKSTVPCNLSCPVCTSEEGGRELGILRAHEVEESLLSREKGAEMSGGSLIFRCFL